MAVSGGSNIKFPPNFGLTFLETLYLSIQLVLLIFASQSVYKNRTVNLFSKQNVQAILYSANSVTKPSYNCLVQWLAHLLAIWRSLEGPRQRNCNLK